MAHLSQMLAGIISALVAYAIVAVESAGSKDIRLRQDSASMQRRERKLQSQPSCRKDTSILILFEDLQGFAVLRESLKSESFRRLNCADVFPETSGSLVLECNNGHVTAGTCSCFRRCFGGSVVRVQHLNDSSQVVVPTAGLDGGAWTSENCSAHFPNTFGHIGVLCVKGVPKPFGQCSNVPTAVCSVSADTMDSDLFYFSVMMISLLGLFCFVVGCGLACSVCCKRQHTVEELKGPQVPPPFEPPPPPPLELPRTFVTEVIKEVPVVKEVTVGPTIYAELAPSHQLPLDVVFCLDSSCSVGQEDFEHTVRFVKTFVNELEMPPVEVGIIRFNHCHEVVCEMQGRRDTVLNALDKTAYIPGETVLAPSLEEAARMMEQRRCSRGYRKKAVIVVSDGDPSDSDKAEATLKRMGTDGCNCVLIQVCTGQKNITSSFHQASQRQFVSHQGPTVMARNLSMSWTTIHQVGSYRELDYKLHALLGSVVEVSKHVRRAKCDVDWKNYQVVPDIDQTAGYELMHAGWSARGHDEWAWECGKHQDPHLFAWDGPPPRVDPPRPQVQEVATVRPKKVCSDASTLTDPLIRVQLSPWRQAPLDLVVLMDSSASFCLERQVQRHSRGQHTFVESGTFQRAKAFSEFLVQNLEMPEVQVGIIRFEDKYETICPLTSNLHDISNCIRNMEPMAGETKLGPPLAHAMTMLEEAQVGCPERQVKDSHRLFPVSKAVLVITDGEPPSDRDETKEQLHLMTTSGVKIVFVKIHRKGNTNRTDYLRTLCSPFERGSPLRRDREPKRALQGLFEVRDERHALEELVPRIFEQMLCATRRISRAACVAAPVPYLEADDNLGDTDFRHAGLDILLPEAEVILDPETITWDSTMLHQENVAPPVNSAIVRLKVAVDSTALEVCSAGSWSRELPIEENALAAWREALNEQPHYAHLGTPLSVQTVSSGKQFLFTFRDTSKVAVQHDPSRNVFVAFQPEPAGNTSSFDIDTADLPSLLGCSISPYGGTVAEPEFEQSGNVRLS